MRILTVTNLYPRPDQPQRGLFNAQQFRAMAEESGVSNVCLVPEWRPWRWKAIRQWQDPFPSGVRTRYLPVIHVPVAGRNLSWRFQRAALRTERDWIEDCDAVLAAWLYPDGAAAVAAAAPRGKPVWLRVHGTDRLHLRHPRRGRVARSACARAAGILVNCEYLADQLVVLGLSRASIHVVPNGVDTELFRYRPRAEAWREIGRLWGGLAAGAQLPGPEGKLVLFAGNLLPVKGPDVLLRAWAQVPRREPQARLVLIGEGPMRNRLRALCRRLGVERSVVLLGSRPHAEIPLWMNAADCLCLPSRSEGLPNVVLEALASGLPVAAADAGGVREVLGDEPDARVVEREAPAALALALCELLARTADRAGMARRHGKRWSWRQAALATLGLMGGGEGALPRSKPA